MTRKDTTMPTNAGCAAADIIPLLHSEQVQPNLRPINQYHPFRSKNSARLTASQRGICLRRIQRKLQAIERTQVPTPSHRTWTPLIPNIQGIGSLGQGHIRIVLLVRIYIPHNLSRRSRYNSVRRAYRICITVVADGRNRKVCRRCEDRGHVPPKRNDLTRGDLVKGRRCLRRLCHGDTASSSGGRDEEDATAG